MNQKGFVNTLLIVFIVVLISTGIYFISARQITRPIFTLSPTPTPTKTLLPSPVTKSGGVTVTSITPSSGPIGTKITISGSGFTSTNNSVIFGEGMGSEYPKFTSSDGRTIIFTVPAKDNPMCPDERPCPIRIPNPIEPGTYEIAVSNANGISNKLAFTVTQTQ